MEKEYHPGEKEIKEWIKELEDELEDKESPFYRVSLEVLEKQLQKIEFKIGHLSLLEGQIEGGQRRMGVGRREIIPQIAEEIKELEKKKQDKQGQIEKKDIEIKYREFKLQYLKNIIKQMA